MPTFKIWLLGTREACIEEANSAREACEKAGWQPEECEVQVVPEENIVRLRPRRPELKTPSPAANRNQTPHDSAC